MLKIMPNVKWKPSQYLLIKMKMSQRTLSTFNSLKNENKITALQKKTPIGWLMAALDDLMTKWLSHWKYWQSLIWSHVTIQYSFHLSFLNAVFFKDKFNKRVWSQITIMALYLSSREKAKFEFDKNVAKLILLLLSCLSASDKGGFWR